MNYKKRDDELIKLNKQARAKANIGNNSGNVGYTENAFRSRKKLPELQNSPNKATTQANNLTDKGFSGSKSSNTIDFDYVLKNDKYWGNKGMSVGALDIDSDYRRKMGRTESEEDNAKYYQRFGMSRNEVLDQYDKYKRETHPIRTAFEEDFRSAPDRAVTGALGSLAHLAFPHSDLDKMANSDFVQRKNREVQRDRDYVQNSNKLTDTQKAIARGVESGGDFLTNMATAGVLGGGGAIADVASGVGTMIQPAKWVSPFLNGLFNYGSTSQEVKHDLERQGVDSDTAYNMGNASGAISGAAGALMMGTGGKAASTGANWLMKALAEGGRIGGISLGQQGLQEIANQLILDNQSTFNNDVQNYVAQGYSEEEAANHAAANVLGRVGSAGATGFLGGAGFSLLGSGLSKLASRSGMPSAGPSVGPNVGPEYNGGFNEYAQPSNNRPLLTQVDALPDNGTPIPSIEGMMTLGLPKKQLPSDAIRMPGTQGVINLPGQTEPIYLPDLRENLPLTESNQNPTPLPLTVGEENTAPSSSRNNPRIVTPLTEEQRVQAESRLDAIRTEKQLMQEELNGYKNKKRLPKEQKARRDLLKERISEHTKEETRLTNQLKGKAMSVKDILKSENYDAYNSIYNWKGDESTFAKIDNIVKFAGNTPEAKQLGKQIKTSLENLLETGDVGAFAESGWEKAVYALDAMAKAKETEGYIPFGDYSYSDRYGDIWNFLADDSSKIGNLGLEMNAKYPMPQAETPVPTGESAPVENTSLVPQIEPNFTLVDTPKNPMFDLDLQFFSQGQKPNNGYWLRLLGDSDFLQQEAQKNNVTPDVLKQYANYNLGYDGTTNNAPKQDAKPDNSYWLRLLGDDAFLQSEAAKHNTDPQTLRAYANANMGYGEAPTSAPKKEKRTFFDDSLPKGKKTSQYYTNTMRNTEENAKMSDAEYGSKFDESEYQYDPTSDDANMAEGRSYIKEAGGHDDAVKKILNENVDGETGLNHRQIDAGQILADEAEKAARDLEAQGLDATEKWLEAHRLHKKIREGATVNAQAMQALKKWKNKTPQGAVDNLITETNRAIDKKKTKGYTQMVDHLADEVEDAIRNSDNVEQDLHDIFKKYSGKSGHNTDKYEQMVLNLVGGVDAHKRSSADLAQEAARLIKRKMGVSTLTPQEERAMINLLEKASEYEMGSRAYNELISRAMTILDDALPSSFGDKVKAIMYDNMLASIKTMFTRNFGGNLGANAIENIATPFQVGADWLVGKVTGERSRTLSGKAIVEGAKGMGKGFKDVYLDVKDGVNTVRSGQESMNDALNAVHKTFKTQSDKKFIQGANRALNVYDRGVRKFMEAGDRPIYEAKYAATKAELYALVDKYGDEGLRKGLPKGKEYSTDELIEFIAINEALESVLQNDSKMKDAAKALKQFVRESSEDMLGFDVASMSIAPFVEVPANMASRFFQFTPVGVIGNIARTIGEKVKYGEINQRRFTGETGRNVLGGLGALGAMGLAAKKFISDPYSEDKDERKLQQNNGYQEYSLQTPDSSTQVDISDIPIVGPMTRYGKMQYDAFKEGGIPALIENTPNAIGAATVDTLYQGLNKLTGSSNKYNSGDSIVENAKNAVMSSLGSLAVPSIVRQTAQYLDPYKRDLGDYGTAEYNKNLFINGLPILRQKLLEPKIDTAGNEVKELGGSTGLSRFMNAYLAPWKTTHPTENLSEAQKYAQTIKEQTDGKVNPQPPVFNAKDLKNTKGYDAENYSHSDLRKIQEDFYTVNTERANELIKQEWFTSLPYEKQGKYLDELYSANKELAKENLVRDGKTPEEIAQAGESLYTGDSKLTKIMRNNDNAVSDMLEYFQNKAGLDAINEEHGSSMDYDTYVKKEAEYDGGAKQYAEDKAKTDELNAKYGTNMKVETYVKKEEDSETSAEEYAKASAETKKLNEKYGYNMQVDTYIKKENEKKGGAEEYIKEASQKKNGESNSAAKEAGFVSKDGSANTAAYDKGVEMFGQNQTKLNAYSQVHSKGYKHNKELVPELINNNSFTAEDKGKILMAEHGYDYDDLGKTAKGAYDHAGYEGVWDFYMLKQLADTDGSGRITKDEKVALMNSNNPHVTALSDDMYYYLGGAKW